jgi:hypothetical protein
MPSLVTSFEYWILIVGMAGSIVYGVVAWLLKK